MKELEQSCLYSKEESTKISKSLAYTKAALSHPEPIVVPGPWYRDRGASPTYIATSGAKLPTTSGPSVMYTVESMLNSPQLPGVTCKGLGE